MGDTWLVLDCPFLAHRNQAVLDLTHDKHDTAVVFGMMRDLVGWMDLFRTDKVAFCFDWGRNKRMDVSPEYKANRKRDDRTDEEREFVQKLRNQISRLAEEDLFSLGFRNVLYEDGFEADDVIASVVLNLPDEDEAVIVASDADLYQLISPNVMMYNPRGGKRKTYQWFVREYGIEPGLWADVKAIAGCNGDNVVGLRSVGEQTAVRYLRGDLKRDGKNFKKIADGVDLWKYNLKLVKLPFEGTPVFELREDKLSKDRWERFCDRYAIKSLRGLYPGR